MKYVFILLFFLLLGCGGNSHSADSATETTGITLKLGVVNGAVHSFTVVAKDDSLELYSKQYPWINGTEEYRIEGVPFGDSITIEVSLLNSKKRKLYVGSAICTILADSINRVSMTMKPLFAQIYIEIPVGIDNSRDIQGGVITIYGSVDSVSVPLQGEKPVKYFSVPSVLYGEGYTVQLYLWNAKDTLYEYISKINIDERTPADLEFALHSLISQLHLDLVFAETTTARVRALYPDTKKRAPEKFQDLIISELSPNPKALGDLYEWIELFNMGMDTLNLKGCSIKKELGSISTTTKMEILSDLYIKPAGLIILGRDSVDFADYFYTGFKLGNEKDNLLLSCNSVIIDSLMYTKDLTNAYPLVLGTSLDIDPKNYSRRAFGFSWCAGKESYTFSQGLENFGSPHRFGNCELP